MVSEAETIGRPNKKAANWPYCNLSNIEAGQVKPGEVRNPNGRPKKEKCITDQIRATLDKIPELLPNSTPNSGKLTNAQIFADQMVLEALKGNSAIVKEVLDRVEGKVKEVLEQTINDVTPIADMTPAERKTRIIDILKATNRN